MILTEEIVKKTSYGKIVIEAYQTQGPSDFYSNVETSCSGALGCQTMKIETIESHAEAKEGTEDKSEPNPDTEYQCLIDTLPHTRFRV